MNTNNYGGIMANNARQQTQTKLITGPPPSLQNTGSSPKETNTATTTKSTSTNNTTNKAEKRRD